MRKRKFVDAFNKNAAMIINNDSVKKIIEFIPEEYSDDVNKAISAIKMSNDLKSPMAFDTIINKITETYNDFISDKKTYKIIRAQLVNNVNMSIKSFNNITDNPELRDKFIEFTDMILKLSSLNAEYINKGIIRIINALIIGSVLVRDFINDGIDESKIDIVISEIINMFILFSGKIDDDIVKSIKKILLKYNLFNDLLTVIPNELQILGLIKLYFS